MRKESVRTGELSTLCAMRLLLLPSLQAESHREHGSSSQEQHARHVRCAAAAVAAARRG